ncbi:MAG: RNA polymerase sigma factor [Melioribacteraceae bacterium]|nr:RNA polymerase sigma factor [Melioribacteraceae bacterium]MCF8265021.1 RNA polymerase sigma factor [Melioribacteraceae bacterium]MCF8413816.1 RNA polymerase sigma factor [Melioribacteraceae bacterium]
MDHEREFKLIREFLDGSESAFNEIVRNYQKTIYWHARKMLGNHIDADDVTQEVIIILYRKLSSFKFNSSLSTWIYRITSNKCINHIRSQKVRRFFSIDDDEANELRENSDLINDVENKEKLELLDNVLQKLPAKQREVFILRNYKELSYEEISEISGKSVGGLKANYFHALRKVMELMENEKS